MNNCLTKLIFDIHTTTGSSSHAPKVLTGTLTKFIESDDKDIALGIAKAQLIDSLPGRTTYACEKNGVTWYCINNNHESVKTEIRLISSELLAREIDEAV